MASARLIVAIDGPAGAGKSAAARELAFRLGVPYLDTGAMYRAVALLALRAGIAYPYDATAERALAEIAGALDVRFAGDPRAQRVALAGEDVTDALRSPEVSQAASQVSAVVAVRRELVRRQRELGERTGGVVEGRDIGTVVFPEAPVKLFLTASPEVRAQRRFDELRKRGVACARDSVVAEQRERDERDSTRAHSPLMPAGDALIVDTSAMTLPDVVARLLAIVESKAGARVPDRFGLA